MLCLEVFPIFSRKSLFARCRTYSRRRPFRAAGAITQVRKEAIQISIDVIQLVQGALTESVLQQLATKLGVAPEAAKRVVGMIAPALVGSLMNKAASPEGARSLFASIMSPDSNANIVEMLPQLVH